MQPAIFHIRRGDQELNPFDAVDQLMAGKLSRDAWAARCRELGISQLVLLPAEGVQKNPPFDSVVQAELFSLKSGDHSVAG